MGSAMLKRDDKNSVSKTEQINSDFLHFYADTDTLVTHLPVSIIRGEDRFFADSLHADNVSQVLQLKGRVKVKSVPMQSP